MIYIYNSPSIIIYKEYIVIYNAEDEIYRGLPIFYTLPILIFLKGMYKYNIPIFRTLEIIIYGRYIYMIIL